MPMMTPREFDQVLAAFSFVLEQAITEPPVYFDQERLGKLQVEVEEIRLQALEKEASAQLPGDDLDGQMLHWINMIGRHLPMDK
jgi:hypothetical protein